MNLLHRHVFRQVLGAASLALTLFVFVLVVGNLLRDVLDRFAGGQLDWVTFGYLLAMNIPGVLPYALPLGLLTGVLLVVGRLAAQNEYTAMRACGLSLWTIAAPVLVVCCLGVVFSLFINFFYAPAADDLTRSTLKSLAQRDPLRFFQPRVFIRDFPGYVLYFDRREGPELRDCWVWELDPYQRVVRMVRAGRGRIEFDPASNTLHCVVHDTTPLALHADNPEDILALETVTGTLGETRDYPFSLEEAFGAPAGERKLSLLTLPQLLEVREQPPASAVTPEQRAAWGARVDLQIQKHAAGAFAVLALGLLGIPLGLTTGRSETFVNLALALGLALTYYMMLFGLSLLETRPALRPDWLIWLPNFVFEALGLGLLWRAARR